MYAAIIALEEQLNSLLPVERKPGGGLPANLLPAAIKWSEAVWEKAEETGALSIEKHKIETAIKFSSQAVFICGTHRSGTTLLRDLLDGHPLLSVLPSEGSFLTNQYRQLLQLPPNQRCAFMGKEWLRRLANPINQPPYWLLGRSSADHSPYIDFARTFIAWWHFFTNRKDMADNKLLPLIVLQLAYAFTLHKNAVPTYTCWVDKTPGNENYISLLRQQFPFAKFIHVLRNPVHILASRKKVQPQGSLRSFILEIQQSFKIAVQKANNEDYLVIRYEDLCSNAVETMQTLASFLHIAMLPCLLQPGVAGKPTQPNSSFTTHSAYGKILTPGEHRLQLVSAQEMQLLSIVAGEFATTFGYALPMVNAGRKFLLKIKYRLW